MIETEERNKDSVLLHKMTNQEITFLMANQNMIIQKALKAELTQINVTINFCVKSLRKGGRIIYIGAGTSGRLGVLDAAECVPTFNTDPNQIVGLIAGGNQAMFTAVEGAEDKKELGEQDLKKILLTKFDTVIGIAASGRTPYVMGGLLYAKRIGATTIGIVNTTDSKIQVLSDVIIDLMTGPEILTGSTRLAAGTAQKEVLNIISTVTMIRMGKVYSNLMIDVKPTNMKLKHRAIFIISTITGDSKEKCTEALKAANNEVSTAIIMLSKNVSASSVRNQLKMGTVVDLIK